VSLQVWLCGSIRSFVLNVVLCGEACRHASSQWPCDIRRCKVHCPCPTVVGHLMDPHAITKFSRRWLTSWGTLLQLSPYFYAKNLRILNIWRGTNFQRNTTLTKEVEMGFTKLLFVLWYEVYTSSFLLVRCMIPGLRRQVNEMFACLGCSSQVCLVTCTYEVLQNSRLPEPSLG
jgi:hypothetical protein